MTGRFRLSEAIVGRINIEQLAVVRDKLLAIFCKHACAGYRRITRINLFAIELEDISILTSGK